MTVRDDTRRKPTHCHPKMCSPRGAWRSSTITPQLPLRTPCGSPPHHSLLCELLVAPPQHRDDAVSIPCGATSRNHTSTSRADTVWSTTTPQPAGRASRNPTTTHLDDAASIPFGTTSRNRPTTSSADTVLSTTNTPEPHRRATSSPATTHN